jgi:hypothetical protein
MLGQGEKESIHLDIFSGDIRLRASMIHHGQT